MKKKIVLSALLFSMPLTATASEEVLTGAVRMACEAILCLSAGGGAPSQCNPAINYYYDIKAKKWKDTFKKRLNFLNLCPASTEPDMPSLVRAIASGAGRCDPGYLLPKLNAWCDGESGMFCMTSIPSYCHTFANHPLTRLSLPVETRTCHDDGEGGTMCKTVWVMPTS